MLLIIAIRGAVFSVKTRLHRPRGSRKRPGEDINVYAVSDYATRDPEAFKFTSFEFMGSPPTSILSTWILIRETSDSGRSELTYAALWVLRLGQLLGKIVTKTYCGSSYGLWTCEKGMGAERLGSFYLDHLIGASALGHNALEFKCT
jgi:hypothetical protein